MTTPTAFLQAALITLGAACACALACPVGPPPPLPCYAATFSDQLIASDAAANDQLAQSIAAAHDLLVVGAPLDDDARGSNAGAVYIWARTGTSWLFQQKLFPDTGAPNDRFGQSVAIVGDTVLVGAPFADVGAVDTGAAYVFVRAGGGGPWTQQARLVAADRAAGDRFGSAVALATADLAVIGAPFEETPPGQDRGAVYTFTRADAAWSEQQKLVAPNAIHGDQFGAAVAARAGVIAVSAPFHDVGPAGDAGEVSIFESDGGPWSFRQALTADKTQPVAYFGSALALGDGLLVVGARRDLEGDARTGAAYVFTRAGATWAARQRLLAGGGQFDDQFGAAAAIAGQNLLIGAPNGDPPFFPNSGVGYLFTPAWDGTWTRSLTFAAPKPSLGMALGASVAAGGPEGEFAFWGAPLDNVGGSVDAGSVVVFDYLSLPPQITDQPDDVRTCRVTNVSFSIQFRDDGSPQFQWRRDGVDLDDGPTPTGSALSGVHTPTLNISSAGPADDGHYDVVLTNACGPAASAAASLIVCISDWTCDGVVNSTDVNEFVNNWFVDQANGSLITDIDANGLANSTDVSEYVNRWLADITTGC